MDARTLLICFLTAVLFMSAAQACTCMYSHPQEHYCTADFVALVRVKQQGKGDRHVISYHIRVKKEFKMSDKARQALSQGLIRTSAYDSTCGVTLKNTRYLITGRVIGEKAYVNLCNFVEEWSKLSQKQRKGFRRLYHQGCQCKVRMMGSVLLFGSRTQSSGRYCPWETLKHGSPHDCQYLYSVCVPAPQHPDRCTWVNNSAYRYCMKSRSQEKKLQREMEP